MWLALSSSPVVVFSAVLVGLLAASEIGFRVGRWRRVRADASARSLVGATRTSFIGLLALLLGFAFAFAAARYDTRRDALVREANAISTAYQRADLLPEPQRAETQSLLKRYVAERLRAYDLNTEAASASARESGVLVDAIWSDVVMATDERRIDPVIASTVLTAFNEVFSSSEQALVAFENSIPVSILGLLSIVAAISAAVTGYSDGLSRKRMLLLVAVQPMLVALVIAAINDLDRPFSGVVNVSLNSLTRAAASMH
jgi:hypothetical protein